MDDKPQDFWQDNQTALAANDPDDSSVQHDTNILSSDEHSISWEASEYVHHEKDSLWFIGVAVAGLLLVAMSLFLIKSITFTVLVVVMVVAVMVLATRPPRTIRYQLGPHGLQIDDKKYNFHDFKAFGVQQEGGIYSILLLPVHRFMPGVSVYFPPDQGESIVDIIGSFVPMEKITPDFIDTLTRKLRF